MEILLNTEDRIRAFPVEVGEQADRGRMWPEEADAGDSSTE